jgi:hypothetical protein
MDRSFTLDHAAGNACLRVRLGVALDDIQAGDDHAVAVNANDFALLALVLAGIDDNLVALLDTVSHDYLLALTELRERARRSS